MSNREQTTSYFKIRQNRPRSSWRVGGRLPSSPSSKARLITTFMAVFLCPTMTRQQPTLEGVIGLVEGLPAQISWHESTAITPQAIGQACTFHRAGVQVIAWSVDMAAQPPRTTASSRMSALMMVGPPAPHNAAAPAAQLRPQGWRKVSLGALHGDAPRVSTDALHGCGRVICQLRQTGACAGRAHTGSSRCASIPWHAPDGTCALQGASPQLDRLPAAVLLPPLHPHGRDSTWPEIVDTGGRDQEVIPLLDPHGLVIDPHLNQALT
jgi:hypothetical protein